jgi:hypothetical protein
VRGASLKRQVHIVAPDIQRRSAACHAFIRCVDDQLPNPWPETHATGDTTMSAFAGSACWRQTAQARASNSLRAFSEAATMAWRAAASLS